MLSEEDDRLAPLPPTFPRTFQNYFLKNGLKKKKEGGSMEQWWEFLVLAGLEQKLSVCQRRKSFFICYSSTQSRLACTWLGFLQQSWTSPSQVSVTADMSKEEMQAFGYLEL